MDGQSGGGGFGEQGFPDRERERRVGMNAGRQEGPHTAASMSFLLWALPLPWGKWATSDGGSCGMPPPYPRSTPASLYRLPFTGMAAGRGSLHEPMLRPQRKYLCVFSLLPVLSPLDLPGLKSRVLRAGSGPVQTGFNFKGKQADKPLCSGGDRELGASHRMTRLAHACSTLGEAGLILFPEQ